MKNIYEVNYMNDKNIDERIKNICLQAENNYILNYSKSSPQNDKIKINNINNNIYANIEMPLLDKTMTYSNNNNDINNENIQNEIFNNNQINIEELNRKENIFNNKIINQSKDNFSRNNNININNNNINEEMVNSMNNKIKYRSDNMISLNTFNSNNNENDNYNNNSKLILTQSEIKNINYNNTFFSASPSFCFECDLHHLINDKNIYNKDLNIKVRQNKEINKIILKGKSLLQKNRLKKAYELLKEYIINSNIKHPDLFYSYGETCRKLKYMEDAEKFLLDCMNFKNCSPYVYLSLAEFYKETGQIKFSKQFYKKCLLYFSKGNIYYNLSFIYMKLNKPLKALNFITEAINLDKNVPAYYKFRSEVYKILGHKDLSEKDIFQYNILVKN